MAIQGNSVKNPIKIRAYRILLEQNRWLKSLKKTSHIAKANRK
jgi:hypothetical protein